MPPRACKFCDAPVKRKASGNYNVTCGSAACRAKSFTQKRGTNIIAIRPCAICMAMYRPTSQKQRYCVTCAPTKGWRARCRRYGIGKPEWDRLVRAQGGTCALCLNVPEIVDHDHET